MTFRIHSFAFAVVLTDPTMLTWGADGFGADGFYVNRGTLDRSCYADLGC